MNEASFDQDQAAEKTAAEKILEEIFGCSIAEFIEQVVVLVPEHHRRRASFLLNKAIHLLNQEQLQKGGELAGGAKKFGDLLAKVFENYLKQ